MVSVFTRSITDNLASLVKQIDKAVAANKLKQLKAFVVVLSDDPDVDEPKLKALAKKHGIKNVPLTVFDGIAGPPSYKIKKGAETTVLMWRRGRVQANRGFEKGKLDKGALKTVATDTTGLIK
ncbi:MAG: hypothetical protein CMJ45_13445 [Planctomyces sp.]|nr:hypothetical protein [Planctomyces sp.]